MNSTLFKRSIRSNAFIWVIFAFVLMMYLGIIVSMYNPESQNTMMELLKTLPPALINAFGFSTTSNSLVGFIGDYYFGFIALIFPMIFYCLVNYRLVVQHVESGSMAYLLSSDTKREHIIFTQMCVSLLMTSGLIILVYIAGIGTCQWLFKGQLDITIFNQLCLGVWLLHMMLSSISFVASCLFNEGRKALGVGAGIPIACFLLQMLANIGDKFEFLKYFSLFTLFDSTQILKGDGGFGWCFFVMGLIAVAFYGIAVYGFKKRDLPL